MQEPNLGKTNLRVSLAYSLGICFAPSLADSFIFLTLTRLVVVFIFCKFQFRPIHPPSRRLSEPLPQARWYAIYLISATSAIESDGTWLISAAVDSILLTERDGTERGV